MKVSVSFRSAAVLAVAALLVAGCSSTSAAATPDATGAGAVTTTAPASGQSQQSSGQGGGTGQGGAAQAGQNRQPGVSGTIAAVSGKTLQVQSASAQTAVSYMDSTVITTTKTATLADVVAGVCVAVIELNGPTSGASTSAAPTTTSGSKAASAGSRVTITDTTNGTCTAQGFGGFGPNQPFGAAGSSSSAAPTADGASGRGARIGQAVFGLVSAVNGSSITVTDSAGASQTATVTAATTYSKITTGDPSALVVGQCARAVGPEDSSGAVTAGSIAVSAPGQGGCNVGANGQGGFSGFGGQGGFGGGRGYRPGGGVTAPSTTNG